MKVFIKNTLLLSFFLFSNFLFSQEIKKDSTKTNELDEVVITGQYSKQSVKKSVFDVTIINSKTIEQNAANNLADLLNQNLNIQIAPNAAEGKSKVFLFGLDGEYFKILQDGIPMVSDDGFGNNIDLTQINLDNIKQIEIVEGSMGVTYGANAVSGIINIITKKGSKHKWEISTAVQEETVGNEYEWWNKGRHIQKLKVSHNINENFYINTNFSRNHFTGFFGEKKGKDYFLSDDLNHLVSDSLRGHEWLPKEQITTSAMLNYSKNKFKIIYKVGFLKELLNKYDKAITESFNQDTQQIDILSINDNDFLTKRMTHDIIANGKINNKINYNILVAYQAQNKETRRVVYDLITRESDKENYQDYASRKTYFSKITLNNFVSNKPYNFEVGLEYNLEDGVFSAVASALNSVDAKEKLSIFDGFITAEYEVNNKLKFRPGIRLSLPSQFDSQLSYSLSTRYLLKNNFELRNVIGSTYKTPTFDELFTIFIDSNHDITGNENLNPERSLSVFTHLKKSSYFKNGITLKNKIKVGYLSVDDRIELIEDLNNSFKFHNIDDFKSVTFSIENTLKYKDLKFNLGITYQGISQVISNEDDDDFSYSFQLNSNISYFIKKINTSFLFNYKFIGKQERFTPNNAVGSFIKQELESYSWSDVSLKKSFLNKKIETTIGVRNLFNVTTLSSSSISSNGTHSSNSNGSLLGYGTSYFFKLKYNLNI